MLRNPEHPSLPLLDTKIFLRQIGPEWKRAENTTYRQMDIDTLIQPWIDYLSATSDGLLSVLEAKDNNRVRGSSRNVGYWFIFKDFLIENKTLEPSNIPVADKHMSIESLKERSINDDDNEDYGPHQILITDKGASLESLIQLADEYDDKGSDGRYAIANVLKSIIGAFGELLSEKKKEELVSEWGDVVSTVSTKDRQRATQLVNYLDNRISGTSWLPNEETEDD